MNNPDEQEKRAIQYAWECGVPEHIIERAKRFAQDTRTRIVSYMNIRQDFIFENHSSIWIGTLNKMYTDEIKSTDPTE